MKKLQVQKTGNAKVDAALENLKKAIEEENQPVKVITGEKEEPHHFFGLAGSCC